MPTSYTTSWDLTAAPLIQKALRLYEQKGNLVSAGKARALLGELQKRSAP